MHPFRYALMRRAVMAAEDGGAGGGGSADPNAGGGAAATTGGDPPSIFDAAGTGAPPTGTDGKPVRPDYVAEQFWDAEKGEVRTEQMARSWKDLRGQVSRGEGKMPETAEGYTLPTIEGMPADLIKADDPLWVAVRTAAHAHNVTEAQLQALVKPYLAAMTKAQGAAPDPEAERAAIMAERRAELALLGPGGEQLVRDVGGWIGGMEASGALTKDEAQALKALGTAAGVRALAKMREAQGHPAIPTDAYAADAMSQADAQKMLQDGYATKDQAKIDKATNALNELQRRGMLKPAA
ncbi:hypothetical protein GXW78_16870 [Roseomonas terrae]|uniref:Scaffolding protein n=1 Tax=Neoroseomonas terrae TaxID=424799 RepID=A0ABS5EJZ4_9PROT|nr:hypothetical protein [Neoroseomonas terrae]MBR0651348.1 hypothetical protein [Neoroseomonas terrae]